VLEFLPSIREVQLHVNFFDWERILAAVHSKTRDTIFDEVKLEEAPKRAEFKKKIQDQLARNANEPIVTVH
jgi:hypothetical protein